MPKYAVIDCETNDIPDYKLPADAPGQPRLAAFGMILLNDDLTIQEQYHALVRPDGWSMAPDATAVNGLTDEKLMAEGKPLVDVLIVYEQAICEMFAIAAFNSQFDCKIMRGELRKAGRPDLFELTPNVCLMRKAHGVIPRRDGKKSWPSLADCRAFLKIDRDDQHTTPADAADALAVMLYLHGAGVDLTPSVHYAKGKPAVVEAREEAEKFARSNAGKELAEQFSERPARNAEIPE